MSDQTSPIPEPPKLSSVSETDLPSSVVQMPKPKFSERLEWVVIDYDVKVMPESEVFYPGLWNRMRKDGTFEMYFHETPDMTFWQFVSAMTTSGDRRIQMVLGHDKEGTAKEHAGVVALTQIYEAPQVRRAVGNFLFFKEYWHRHDSLALGCAVMAHWFETMKFDVIAGITPKQNRAAIQFIHRLGFEEVGEIPSFTVYKGQRCPSVISQLTSAGWAKRKAELGSRQSEASSG